MPNINPSQIKGWGIDANPKNDPTYPCKTRGPAEHEGHRWHRPPLQPQSVEVLKSNERPSLSAVMGTSTPPRGVSGWIRRCAFRYSESSYGHWLPLMMADRVAIMEGYLDDLSHGRLPNPWRERGWGAEWRFNRTNFIMRGVLTVVILCAVSVFVSRKSRD